MCEERHNDLVAAFEAINRQKSFARYAHCCTQHSNLHTASIGPFQRSFLLLSRTPFFGTINIDIIDLCFMMCLFEFLSYTISLIFTHTHTHTHTHTQNKTRTFSVQEVETALAPVEDGSQFYQGGSREMRERIPGFSAAEVKMETMVSGATFLFFNILESFLVTSSLPLRVTV